MYTYICSGYYEIPVAKTPKLISVYTHCWQNASMKQSLRKWHSRVLLGSCRLCWICLAAPCNKISSPGGGCSGVHVQSWAGMAREEIWNGLGHKTLTLQIFFPSLPWIPLQCPVCCWRQLPEFWLGWCLLLFFQSHLLLPALRSPCPG